MTRRSLFKRILGVVAGLCGVSGAKNCLTGELVEFYFTLRTNGGEVSYWFDGQEFIRIGERT